MNAGRDRDPQLEDALRHGLRAGGTDPLTDTCLDAETVAAWTDGGLDATTLAMAEAHAANCARCQALLATVARTLPAATAANPGTARLWRWWMAPLAAGAAAVTVWMVLPGNQLTARPAPSIVAERAAPATELAKEAPAASVPPAPEAARPAPAPPALGRQRAGTAAPSERAEAGATAEGRVVAAPPALAMSRRDEAVADQAVTSRSSPSEGIIWAVGRAGLVQLATDGRTFVRLPFPEAVDLVAVTATDQRHAGVTAADGRVFQTTDGGRTWTRP